MTSERIIELLNVLVKKGTPIRNIERSVGMPTNNLSGILSGKRGFIKKWAGGLEDYIANNIANNIVNNIANKEKPESKAKVGAKLTDSEIQLQIKEWENKKCFSYMDKVKFDKMQKEEIKALKGKISNQ